MIDGEFTSGAALKIEATKRLLNVMKESVQQNRLDGYLADGWEVDRKMKSSIRLKKTKPHDRAFEDRVWAMFARLGFAELSKGRSFKLRWSNLPNATKQIDVFAMDDETVLIVECKSSGAKVPPTATFKDEADIIRGLRSDLLPLVKKEFPGKKIKFVLAVNNFAVSEESIERIEDMDVSFLDERLVDYYLELSGHLGAASKYQFLASVFRGTRIPGLEGKVAAIQGKMGGTDYFTFMIEPSRMLKLAYVLHRNSTSGSSVNTYQRIIKRPRLKKVQAFVDGGGYFPNSLVVNIDSGGRDLRFEQANVREGQSRLGILHLPQNYGAAYVIDGQHRLYGFAEAVRADKELVPVVAFVDMRPEQQVKLFMQINENQQAVPKNLRNTLNSDLLWHSESLADQAKALRLRIAQHLGEEKSSPLMGRIILGEDKVTRTRCISIDAVTRGIDKGGFVGDFTAKEMRSAGLFYRGNVDRTVRPLSTFVELVFKHIVGSLPRQWELGKADGGFVFMNNGVEALLRVTGDLVAFVEQEGRVNPKAHASKDVFEAIRPELDAVIGFLEQASRETALELRSTYGSAGATRFWRRLQMEVASVSPSFRPEGLPEYQRSQVKQTAEEARAALPEAIAGAKYLIRDVLEQELGADWWREGLPSEVVERAHALRARALVAGEVNEAAEWWDFVPLTDLLVISADIRVSDLLARDARLLLTGVGKEEARSPGAWLERLDDVESKLARNEDVPSAELEFAVTVAAHVRRQSGVEAVSGN
jgi:DNA sulfur modification protein DndB